MEHTRAELPENGEMDEHHLRQRQITLEYLRDKTTREERKEIIKEALKELWKEGLAEFGWHSLKFIGLAAFIGVMYLYLTTEGWIHK